MATTQVKPSPKARQLFNAMVARSGKNLHLSLDATVKLASERVPSARQDAQSIRELEEAEWIDACGDGGWLLH